MRLSMLAPATQAPWLPRPLTAVGLGCKLLLKIRRNAMPTIGIRSIRVGVENLISIPGDQGIRSRPIF